MWQLLTSLESPSLSGGHLPSETSATVVQPNETSQWHHEVLALKRLSHPEQTGMSLGPPGRLELTLKAQFPVCWWQKTIYWLISSQRERGLGTLSRTCQSRVCPARKVGRDPHDIPTLQ